MTRLFRSIKTYVYFQFVGQLSQTTTLADILVTLEIKMLFSSLARTQSHLFTHKALWCSFYTTLVLLRKQSKQRFLVNGKCCVTTLPSGPTALQSCLHSPLEKKGCGRLQSRGLCSAPSYPALGAAEPNQPLCHWGPNLCPATQARTYISSVP